MSPSTNTLAKKIGFWSACSIIIGSIIGAGVFMKPATMAAQVGSPIWLTIVWIIGGLFSLFGALIYAELGAMMPETGGIYVFFKKIFGDFFAFLYGWAAFSVINTAANAAISFVCAQYADYFLHLPRFDSATEHSLLLHIPFIGDLFPLENIGVKLLAVLFVIFLTGLNSRSVKAGTSFQVISSAIALIVLASLIGGIFFFGVGSVENFYQAAQPKHGFDLVAGLIAAMTGSFYAYDGWINITSIAGEIKEPNKNIPRVLILGVLTIGMIYLIVNQAYLYVLPIEKVAASKLVAADAITVVLGNAGGALVSGMIVVCTFGALNGNVLATCRITYAMGQDRLFIPWAGRTHNRYNTPFNAVWLHGIWTALFIITGSFDMLADMFVFVSWVAYLFGAVGVFILRKRMPDAARPYKVWGYPLVPILFISFSGFYLVLTIFNDIDNYLHHRTPVINSLLGLAITALGLPIYFYCKKRFGIKK